MRLSNRELLALSCLTTALVTGCGKKASLTVGLDKIPSASQMAASTATQSATIAHNARGETRLAVQGTPPKLLALGTSNADQYFWNGLVAAINGAGSATPTQSNQFWGGINGGPGGNSACQMAQSVAQNFRNILNSANSTCYMKGMSTINNTPTLFSQGESDKNVLVNVSHMNNGGGGPSTMDVHITVYGTKTVGSNTYKVQLYMCSGGSVNQREILTVDKTTGSYVDTSDHNNGGGSYDHFSLTAGLASDGAGGLKFDTARDRVAVVTSIQSGSTWGGNITISANQIAAKMYNSGTWGGHANTDKTYSLAHFTGSQLSDLTFSEGASSGMHTESGNTFPYTGATEFQNTYYAAVTASDLLTQVKAYSFTQDAFWSSVTSATAPDFTGLDCNATGDSTVTMDFSSAPVAALQATCEAGNNIDYNMCYSTAVQSAEQIIWSSYH